MTERQNNIVDILSGTPIKTSKSVILDTNYLMNWLQVPGSGEIPNDKYAEVLKILILRKIPILVSSHVYSEYLNRYLRGYYHDQFNHFNPHHDSVGDHYKKYFRNSPEYLTIANSAVRYLKNFFAEQGLDVSYVEGVTSTVYDAEMLVTTKPIDFTDAVLILIAQNKSAAILTDDTDVQKVTLNQPVTVYTTIPVR